MELNFKKEFKNQTWVANITDKIVSITTRASTGDAKTYWIHKKLVEDASRYFKSAFNNGFVESKLQEVTLADEEDVLGLPVFMKWLYTGIFDYATAESDEKNEDKVLMELCKIFVFADKRGIHKFRRQVVNAIIQQTGLLWDEYFDAAIKYAYENSPQPSVLRRVLSSSYGRCSDLSFFEESSRDLWHEMADCPDFIADIVMILASRANGQPKISKKEWKGMSYRDFAV